MLHLSCIACPYKVNNLFLSFFFFLSCFRLLGLPRAKMLHAYNPSRDRDVVVNSVFTATRQFHVSPAHSRVSVDVLLETM